MTDARFSKIEAVLFDLDGTLMDTDDQTVERVAKFLSKLGISDPKHKARRLVMVAETPVNGVITLLDIFRLDNLISPFWHKMGRMKRKTRQFRIIPGVVEMLASLRGQYRLAVVTTRGQEEAEIFITENGLQGVFEVLVTRSSTRRLKPSPEPILFAASALNLPVDHCLMVGDTTMDIRSASRAGVLAVGVLCGFGTRNELEKEGATEVLPHIKSLAGILKK
jgi:N-acetyl-D-muramate 6-phosphate phosphatase